LHATQLTATKINSQAREVNKIEIETKYYTVSKIEHRKQAQSIEVEKKQKQKSIRKSR